MEIIGVMSKPNTVEVSKAPQVAEGASFLGSVAEAVREGKIVVPGGTEMEKLDFLRTKFGAEKNLKIENSEEDLVYGFLARIKRILEENKR